VNIEPFPVNPTKTKWVAAVNPSHIDSDGITGSRSHSAERSRLTAEGFWSESDKRWIYQHALALHFDSSEEAQAFIDQHSAALQSTPIL
jgi:hypothetical protein